MLKRRLPVVIVFLVALLVSGMWTAPGPAYRADGTQAARARSPMVPTFGGTCGEATYASGTLPYQTMGTTWGWGDDYHLGGPGTCVGGGTSYELTGLGEDFVIMVATDITCDLGISMDPDDTIDLALYVLYPDCDDVPGNCVIVNDVGGQGVPEDVEFRATAGESYYVIVDGYNGDNGGFALTISEATSNGCQLVDLHADLGDTVWEDSNANGILEDAEVAIFLGGVTVNLYECGGAFVDSTITDYSSPAYLFIDLDPGSYYLEFVPPGGYRFSPQDQGGNDELDSDAHPATGQTACFQLAPGDFDMSRDAGMYRGYDLGNRVWYDTDQDGLQDAGEPGVEGAVLELYRGACHTEWVGSDSTDASGTYGFAGLVSGTYCLGPSSLPGGMAISPKDQGGDDTVDSDANPSNGQIANINLSADDLNEDMGLYVPGGIGDKVWCDADGDSQYDAGEGVVGVTVTLYEDVNCDTVAEGLLVTMDTVSEGGYSFYPVSTGPPGGPDVCYVVQVDVSDMGTCNQPITPVEVAVGLQANAPENYDIDFGFTQPGTLRLGDLVWHDWDRDGIQDAGEPGVAGIATYLLRDPGTGICGGTILANDVTDSNGRYLFTGLHPDTYCLIFDVLSDWQVCPQDQGADDSLDSDADPAAWILNIVLAADDLDEDVGIYRPYAVYLPLLARK